MPYDPIAREKADAAATIAQTALTAARAAQDAATPPGWTEITTDTRAAPGDRLSVNTANRAITVTLPAEGGTLALRDDAGTWGINPCTVFGNGVLIGGQSRFALDAPGFEVTFSMVAGAWRWTSTYLHGAAA